MCVCVCVFMPISRELPWLTLCNYLANLSPHSQSQQQCVADWHQKGFWMLIYIIGYYTTLLKVLTSLSLSLSPSLCQLEASSRPAAGELDQKCYLGYLYSWGESTSRSSRNTCVCVYVCVCAFKTKWGSDSQDGVCDYFGTNIYPPVLRIVFWDLLAKQKIYPPLVLSWF